MPYSAYTIPLYICKHYCFANQADYCGLGFAAPLFIRSFVYNIDYIVYAGRRISAQLLWRKVTPI
jgi:hypothetical protein